jgi:glycosyltransferase involved in cell wall biosynthesis
MLSSTIIPTIGRPSVARAVESVLTQGLPSDEFEVLVINDSGAPLPQADWQRSQSVRIIDTNKRERSVARNTGAAAARGKYLHFLDDDDCIVPGAYLHLKELARSSGAVWLYGITQLADRQDRATIQLRHNLYGNCFLQAMAGEWIPLQASWIERETFLKIGGFNPLLAGPEDIDLLRRILLQHDIAETPNLVARVIMAGDGSSTDYAAHPRMSRWARESILDQPGAYARMSSGARTAMWRGRMTRIYLTSAIWNIQQRRLFTALSRLSLSLACMLQSNVSMLTTDFWKSIRSPYASVTFENGQRMARKEKSLES